MFVVGGTFNVAWQLKMMVSCVEVFLAMGKVRHWVLLMITTLQNGCQSFVGGETKILWCLWRRLLGYQIKSHIERLDNDYLIQYK